MQQVTYTNDFGEEQTVKVGDIVGFKSDIEQYGKVVEIISDYRGTRFKLEAYTTFSGGYIGGQKHTEEEASRCWID